MDLIFAIAANDREFFVSRMDAVASQKECPTMFRKTMIVLAKAAALTSGLTVEAFAHGGGRGHAWSALRMVAR
jgi:hypothetical protein